MVLSKPNGSQHLLSKTRRIRNGTLESPGGKTPVWEKSKLTGWISEEIKDGVANGVNDSLKGGNSRNVPMVEIESGKLPSRRPEEDVVSNAEYPDEGQIGVRNDACSVGNVAPDLAGGVGPAVRV